MLPLLREIRARRALPRGGAARALPHARGGADLPVAERPRTAHCVPGSRPFPTALDPLHLQPLRDRRVRPEAYALGVRYLGVCCGAGPHHIRALAEALGRTRRRAATRPTCRSTPSSAPTSGSRRSTRRTTHQVVMRVAVVGAGFAGGIHAQAWAGIAGRAARRRPGSGAGARLAERWGGSSASSLERALAPDVTSSTSACRRRSTRRLTVAAARAGKARPLREADGHESRRGRPHDRRRAGRRRHADGRSRSALLARVRQAARAGREGCARPSSSPGLHPPRHPAGALRAVAARPGAGPRARGGRDPRPGHRRLAARPAACGRRPGRPEGAGWSHLQVLLRSGSGALASVETGWGTPAAEPFVAGFRAFFEPG